MTGEIADQRALWEGETGWHDLILTLSSHEANQRAEARKEVSPKKAVKATKKTKKINRLPIGTRLRGTGFKKVEKATYKA